MSETPEEEIERCPHAAIDRTQCVLLPGHDGEHQSHFTPMVPTEEP